MSYWTSRGVGHAFKVDHARREHVRRICADTSITKVFFNAKFDIGMLAKEGIKVRGPIICVFLMAQMLLPDEKQKNLKSLARKLLHATFIEETRMKAWLTANKLTKASMHLAPAFIMDPYALADARHTLELFYYLSSGMDDHNMWHVLDREMCLMKYSVIPMEDAGVSLDLAEVDRLKVQVRQKLRQLKTDIVKIVGIPEFNPASIPQVLKALKAEGIFRPTRFTKKGKPSTDGVSLIARPSPLGMFLLEYRKIEKAGSTYLSAFNKKILRVSFNQNGAKTGRQSSSDPNLQNIPRPSEDSLLGQIRRVFIPRPNFRLFFYDYDQIEMRLTAHFSKEEHMLEAINNGVDLHNVVCKKMFNINENSPSWQLMRYLAKTLNFSVLYGTGPETFMATVLKQTMGKIRLKIYEASKYINDWKSNHPGVMKLFGEVEMEAATTGGITNHYGRFIEVARGKGYAGVNYKVQGSAADFMKMKTLEVCDLLDGTDILNILAVHDELGFDIPRHEKKWIPQIKEVMEDHKSFSVPLTVGAGSGKNWMDKKDILVA
tara:strand:- start:24417 stop:26054 length:1638 start_codon:yes stop_codon:yes gene_type:complete